jgi:Arc/MetJ-type ribon-helix-helix transcriptional regulator
MTTLTLELPEALSAELAAAVQSGWFESQAEAVRDLLSGRKLALVEKQQLNDIDWAVSLKGKEAHGAATSKIHATAFEKHSVV